MGIGEGSTRFGPTTGRAGQHNVYVPGAFGGYNLLGTVFHYTAFPSGAQNVYTTSVINGMKYINNAHGNTAFTPAGGSGYPQLKRKL